MVGVIGFIAEQIPYGGHGVGQGNSPFNVGCLPLGQAQGKRTAFSVAQRVDFCVTPAAADPDGLSSSPPFPPPAQR